METITAQIQATLTQRPDVASVKVFYSDDISDPGFATANIKVKAGKPFEPVIDETVRLIWLSQLNPLSSIRIGILDVVDLQRNEVRDLDTDGTDQAALEQEYGPRPR
jgi:hypothetical protein